ncbi:MAG: glycosyltransferase family 2 protein [Selenomonas sp.]|nr:glycosyltransferase family 2 protein [Selenomonas sp.]
MFAAISMVRNEADIIEAFVRHTLTFADHLFIYDHNSTDNTPKILDCLIAEGLSVSLVPLTNTIGYEQAEITTMLMKTAFEQGYSLVIPIDADEFLMPDNESDDLRTLLNQLSTDNFYYLKWVDYRLIENSCPFQLPSKCLRSSAEKHLHKIIVGNNFYKENNCEITQGNHFLRNADDFMLNGLLLVGLHMAHFPCRSVEQVYNKTLVGWLSNVCKFTRHTSYANHWAAAFYHVAQGGNLLPPPLDNYMPSTIPANYVQGDLQYSHMTNVNYMQNLLAVSEELAETVCELKFLQKQIPITIIIFYTGNITDFIHTFKNAASVDYPYMEYVILALPQDTPHDIEELYAYLKKQSDRLDITLLLEDTVDALFMALSQHTRGTYIQWLIPGATIPDNKFRYIGAALTNNPAPMFICHLTLNIEVKTINAKIVFFSQGKNLLSWLREHHIPDNYALTLPLFRQEDIAKLQYLKPCFHDGSFHADILWNSLLPECEILITI